VRATLPLDALPVAGCDNALRPSAFETLRVDVSLPAAPGVQRIAPVRIHDADALARRSPALQQTRDAAAIEARLAADLWDRLRLATGDSVRVRAGVAGAVFPALVDRGLPAGCVCLPAGHASTFALGLGALELERVERVGATAVETVS